MSTDQSISWKIASIRRSVAVPEPGVPSEAKPTVRVYFKGVLDERAEFTGLAERLRGDIVFDLEGVQRITSAGVCRWSSFLKSITNFRTLTFECCSPPVVTQLNLSRTFGQGAEVASFFAPYVCEATGEERLRLLRVAELDPASPPTFEDSGDIFELDDTPQRYFAFLGRQSLA